MTKEQAVAEIKDIQKTLIAEASDASKLATRNLRDRFAMAALEGLCARGPKFPYDCAAKDAYGYADAMLAERARA